MRWPIILIAALAGLSAGCARESATPLPKEGVVALSEQFTGDFALVDKNGVARTDEDFENAARDDRVHRFDPLIVHQR